MYKILVMIAVLVVTLLPAAPASAHGDADGTYWTQNCVAWDGSGTVLRRKENCSTVWWRTQADGTGVVLEFVDSHTVDGASTMSGYYKVKAWWVFPESGNTSKSWDWGVEPENWNKDHGAVYGPDNGAMDYRLHMCSDDNFDSDDHVWFKWRLKPGGDATLIDKGHSDGGSYC